MELTNTDRGIKHGYINDVLKEKNLGVLPCTVNNSGYSVAKQRMLIKIKKEQQDSTVEQQEVNDCRENLKMIEDEA